MSANLENSAVATGLEKVNFHSNLKERQCQRMFKLLHNCTHSHASKVMLKILQARLQQYVNCELPDVQAGFRKGRGTRDQIANIHWIIEKEREFQKNIYFCFVDYAKTFDSVDHNKLWKNLSPILCYLTVLFIYGEGNRCIGKISFGPLLLFLSYDIDEDTESINLYISIYNLECTT